MSTKEVRDQIFNIYYSLLKADYHKEAYPEEMEDVVERLGECLDLLK